MNLYGYCMSFKLRCSNFRFIAEQDIFDFPMVDLNSEKGYLLEVDLSYPPELHDAHSDLPLAPEHITVTPQRCPNITVQMICFADRHASFQIYVTNQDTSYT